MKKYRLPLELAYLPMLESSFNPKAKSRTGALGMWQFTEATAKDYGLKVGWFSDDRLNWRKSTRAAVLYLSRLGKKFNYNWELALAAYNGGPGYIERSMKRQRTWSFWKLKLREEPKEYVPKFIAMLHVARQRHARLYQLRANRFKAPSEQTIATQSIVPDVEAESLVLHPMELLAENP
ncbi:MAG: lytic transglycosylase domain-containing protein [SAR324 cluster bacterium]|nr:lytic transglycosylase domain-containing protein [SAR324 cluster bacterium]